MYNVRTNACQGAATVVEHQLSQRGGGGSPMREVYKESA